MRKTTEATGTSPFRAKWTSASVDATITTALSAPVQIGGMAGAVYIQLSLAGDANTPITFSWQLCLVNNLIATNAATPIPQVMRAILFTTTSTARRQDGVGASGAYFHDDKIIDIGGLGAGNAEEQTWCLCLSSIGGDSGAYLVDYKIARLTGSP